MNAFSTGSITRLNTCHPDLQKVFLEVVKTFDCSILCGHRDEATQNQYYEDGASKVKFPNSKHNTNPSEGIDVAPYPLDWEDTNRFYLFAGYVLGTANQMGVKLRWGGDWDSDTEIKDQTFNDLVHFELVN